MPKTPSPWMPRVEEGEETGYTQSILPGGEAVSFREYKLLAYLLDLRYSELGSTADPGLPGLTIRRERVKGEPDRDRWHCYVWEGLPEETVEMIKIYVRGVLDSFRHDVHNLG